MSDDRVFSHPKATPSALIAELVAALDAAIIEVTVLAECERCAKIAEQKMIEWKDFRGGKELEASFKINAARQIAAAIRTVSPQPKETR